MRNFTYTAPWELSIVAFIFRWTLVVWAISIVYYLCVGGILPQQRLLFIMMTGPGAYVLGRALWWRYRKTRALVWRFRNRKAGRVGP